jgi:DNA-binding transcriptional LysR family regulator
VANPITFESLQLIDTIARRGSFAAAAKELDRAPSAVTYAVRKIEDALDVLLFDRRGYRVRLTPAGEELLREGRHLLAAADDLSRRVQRVAKGWERELRIALDTLIPFARITPLIERFCELAPTQLRFSHEVLGGTWDALVSGRADLAIGAAQSGPEIARLGVGCRTSELGRVEFVFAVAPTHPLAKVASPLPIAELRRHRQVVVSDTSRQIAARTTGLIGAPDMLAVPSMIDKIAAQVAGLGVGYVPLHLVRDEIKQGRLLARATEHQRLDGVATILHAAWRSDARGKAIEWWLARLSETPLRAALLA